MGIHAKQLANFGGAGRVGAVGVRKVLLAEDLVHRGSLDDRVASILDEIGNQHLRDAFSNIDIRAEEGLRGALHGGIVEVENGDAGACSCAEAGARAASRRSRTERAEKIFGVFIVRFLGEDFLHAQGASKDGVARGYSVKNRHYGAGAQWVGRRFISGK